MMDFFANMINRHLGTAEIVEPRARARFEPESRIAAVDIPNNLETEQDLAWREDRNRHARDESAGPAFSGRQLGTNERVEPHARARDGLGNKIAALDTPDNLEFAQDRARREDRIRHATDESTEPDLNVSDKKNNRNGPIIQEQPSKVLKPALGQLSETFQQTITQPRPPSAPLAEAHPPLSASADHAAASKKPPLGAPPLNRGLDDRIETLLQRLRGPQNFQSSATGVDDSERGHRSQPPELDDWDQIPKLRTPSVTPSHGGREEAGKSSKQPVRSLPPEGRKPTADRSPEPAISSIERNPRHVGLLEPPSWLLQMQAEFSRRWQEINPKSEAEPVINVTIGRVEVRAVQAEPPRQPKRKNKPTGVMSLDEYLNQRGRGGRT